MNNNIKQFQDVQIEALKLFSEKNADYGDSFAAYGPIGVLVRMSDKISRLTSITNSGVSLINSESLRDTLIDIHNYSAMAIILMDKKGYNPRIEELKQKKISPTVNKLREMHSKKFPKGKKTYIKNIKTTFS
jgi:hypothetical protein